MYYASESNNPTGKASNNQVVNKLGNKNRNSHSFLMGGSVEKRLNYIILKMLNPSKGCTCCCRTSSAINCLSKVFCLSVPPEDHKKTKKELAQVEKEMVALKMFYEEKSKRTSRIDRKF